MKLTCLMKTTHKLKSSKSGVLTFDMNKTSINPKLATTPKRISGLSDLKLELLKGQKHIQFGIKSIKHIQLCQYGVLTWSNRKTTQMKIIQENRKRAQTHEGWYLRDDKESNFVTTIPSSCWVIPCLSWLSWCEANIYYIILEQKQRGRLEGGIGARWPRNGGDEDDDDEDDGCVVLTRSLFVFVFGWRSRVLCINQRRVRAATCLLFFFLFFFLLLE